MWSYWEGVAKNDVNKLPVTAHMYEYTTQASIFPSPLKISGSENPSTAVPIQAFLCVKEKNQKKINSRRWLFNAFGPLPQLNVWVLLDVGTQPSPTYHLWTAFDINSNVDATCGEICGTEGQVGANFEYNMTNVLDKSLYVFSRLPSSVES
ncbi:Chitin synthase, class 1 [Tricholoma furcatifolium]|nr:Chitin synthase, class 1 [Tricholoma furcatifolium]